MSFEQDYLLRLAHFCFIRNLDPFTKHTDADIWKALEDVELKHIVTGPLGLEFVVFSNGANFSVGEVWTM